MEIKLIINGKQMLFGKKSMGRKNVIFLFAVFFFISGLFIFSGDLVKPNTLEDGGIIYASELNENFNALFGRTLESISNVEIDGIENGDVLKWDGSDWCAAADVYSELNLWIPGIGNIYYTDGTVGIGTTEPDELLELSGGGIQLNGTYGIGFNGAVPAAGDVSGDRARIYYNTAVFGSADDYLIIEKTDVNGVNPDGGIAFVNKGSDNVGEYAMIIRGTGNVGIGRTDPAFPLHMGGGAYCTGTTWVNSSSREYKENIEDISYDEALSAMKTLHPVKFNYKTDKDEEYLGFIAEDVPELVAMNERKGLSAMDMVAVLVKVVQKQQEKIEEFEIWLNK